LLNACVNAFYFVEVSLMHVENAFYFVEVRLMHVELGGDCGEDVWVGLA
jgi:hypothetical protein